MGDTRRWGACRCWWRERSHRALPRNMRYPRHIAINACRRRTTAGTCLRSRVSFQTHDFFQPQPLVSNAYLIYQIAHSWNDDDAIRLFSAFITALECSPPGTLLLINDTILPELGGENWLRRAQTTATRCRHVGGS
ncbi:hypothetical protein GQ43DRAFT_496887 [Delitschia confertaspora ATCC 74209]|uniref:O-methyltransferase C-terminal domain-containing protein n=1 Tax=Delitschia confertaspora ATCC 74209 TaxID=1513339 RepID=A0A9P4JHA2_9PLEO|nr:hypothetical protein GQ43DRAFT_496887 [Delitschia confertaspora ATCC 74209]